MRKLTVAAFLSLDGVMQGPGGREEDMRDGFQFGGWLVPYADEVTGAAVGESFSKPFELLLGRTTYDIFAAHWANFPTDPTAPGYVEEHAKIAIAFNRTTKHVATHSPDTLHWENSNPLRGDVVEAVRALKQTSGPDLLTQGSGQLLQTLLASDLIDEMRLQIYPVVLGKGRRLFGDGSLPHALKLTSAQTSPSGVLVTTYRPDGIVKTGSFLLPNPSDEELRRREKMAR